MSESKSPKPESLEAKFRLMTLAPFDKRMKRKHLAVYGFIIDWYHTKYGNALASVRHVTTTMKERDPSGEGFYLGDVHGALTDLVSWGYLTQEKGSGRRASRYVPVWSKSDSVRKSPNTTHDDPSVRETPNTSVRETPNATADSVRDSTNEDPPTGPGHKTRGHVVVDMFEAAPVAPPADGLMATAAGPASGDGFEEFWNAWPRKHAIKKARAEWKKIIFDVDIVIEAARDWAAHYEKHATAMKWIPEPANWLAGERWREDLPLIHGDAKGAAIAKAKANAPPKKAAAGTVVRDITIAEITPVSGGGYKVKMHFNDLEDGERSEGSTQFYSEEMTQLYNAAGVTVNRPGDEQKIKGTRLVLTVDAKDRHSFAAHPESRITDSILDYDYVPKTSPAPRLPPGGILALIERTTPMMMGRRAI